MSERKYRHRGYMDSHGREDRDRRPKPKREPRPPADLPRKGRGMERSANEVSRCSVCGKTLMAGFVVSPGSSCPSCNASLHSCRNCRHFDTSARYQCTQPIEAPIGDKTADNLCGSFEMRTVLDATGRRAASRGGPSDPRKAFDDLFKK